MNNPYAQFLGKTCKLRFETDFTLRGQVIDATDQGVIFKTEEKSSFINWSRIKQLEVDD